MAKSERLSLRLTESEYTFLETLSDEFDCSMNEVVSKIISISQAVCKTELKDILILLSEGFDVELGKE